MAVLSCIILVSGNIEFVNSKLIPSIRKNTILDYEIIVVYNGKDKTPLFDEDIIVIKSDYLHISRAYNKGIKAANGKYIALFHDDCLLLDREWFQKCSKAINHDVIAVSSEIDEDMPFRLTRMKFVPLVMKGKYYLDEYYYFGKEELDFTYSILSKGKKFKKVEIQHKHYRAMSTIINLSGKDYFDFESMTTEEIRNLTIYYLNKFMALNDNLINVDNEIHFYEKYLSLICKMREKIW